MEHDIKVVIGSGFGDESKGLVVHNLCLNAIAKNPAEIPLVVFSQSSAQRGHTVELENGFRHVFHHFGCGTAENCPTYFGPEFIIHPMTYKIEYLGLIAQKIYPITYFSPKAKVATIFDMIADHISLEWIAFQRGEREYGSCGFGTWCATDRFEMFPETDYSIYEYNFTEDFKDTQREKISYMFEEIWRACKAIVISRGVDIEQLPHWRNFMYPTAQYREQLFNNFWYDVKFFLDHSTQHSFDNLWKSYSNIIFENSQGLGLDKNNWEEWHTTSNTGLLEPYALIKDKNNFSAEVCYVSRAYGTRHGIGKLDNEVHKDKINSDMVDMTNVPNEFQGTLRYSYPDIAARTKRINKDFTLVENDRRFSKSLALTHMNEFNSEEDEPKYCSDNKFTMREN